MSQRIRNELRLNPLWNQIPTTQEDNHYGIVDKYECAETNETYVFYVGGDRSILPTVNHH